MVSFNDGHILNDTNILLRLAEPAHPMHETTHSAVSNLLKQGHTLCVLPQNFREFWNVYTRPIERNGLGASIIEANEKIQRLESMFTLLDDGLEVYREWRRLVFNHSVKGVQVHDAYLVAGMKIHGISSILT